MRGISPLTRHFTFARTSVVRQGGSPMSIEFTAVVLGAVLPIYPALFVIYQKIGKYDVMCEDLDRLREEHDRIMQGDRHGSATRSDH